MNSPNVASVGAPEKNTPQFFRLERSVDSWELKSTLDAYEVQEIDAHDLARFLPVGVGNR